MVRRLRLFVAMAVILASALIPFDAGSAACAPSSELADARARVISLEQEIEELRAERISIEERIAVTNVRIFTQQVVLAGVREELEDARNHYRDRIIRMYKTSQVDPLTILLTADSIQELYSRALILTRISQRDKSAYKDAAIATAEAEYQAAYLDDLKDQDVQLRRIQALGLEKLERALEEQRALVANLSAEALVELQAIQTTHKLTRAQWRESSIPVGGSVETTLAVVEPYSGVRYTVAYYQPTRYRSVSAPRTMVCSWYGNEFNGRPTASGQIFNEEDLTCASRTLPFGTRIALTRGDRRIVVVVTDRGPFIDGRDLDLSKAAARQLGFSGVEPVTAEFVEAIR